jgi:PadR family transcriptional regulator, regulatory protein PadR
MKNNDLKKTILKECSNGQFYGYEINKKLTAKRVQIEIGRLYIILNQMEKEKLISSRWEKSNKGPKKKYYKITENGEKVLHQETLTAIHTIHEAYWAYLMKIKPQKSVFHKIARLIVNEPNRNDNITYFSDDLSPMHEKLLSALQELKPETTIYFVRPKDEKLNQPVEKTVYLEGEYDDFPLKNEFADLLIINGLPKKEKMNPSIQEWTRILREEGKIAVIVPTVILHQPKNPMSLTDFIEQLEHKTGEKYDHKWIMEIITTFFENVEEKKILHITIIVGKK